MSLCQHYALGVVEKYYSGKACKLCKKEYDKKRYAAAPHKMVEASKAWRVANPERFRANTLFWKAANPEKVRNYSRVGHGVVWAPGDSYEALVERTGGRCEICGVSEGKMSVDHDHTKPGVPNVRGLLCDKHNRALGFFGDNVEGLRQALNYLLRAQMQEIT